MGGGWWFQLQVEEVLLEIKPTQTIKEDPQVHVLMEQLDSMNLDIASRLDNLLITLEPGNRKVSSASLEVYGDTLKGVQYSLKDDLSETVKQLMSLDQDNLVTPCNKFEHYKHVIQAKILQAKFHLAERLPLTSKPWAETPITHTQKHKIEMENSKVPTFSGRTIDYPEFTRGW